MLFIIFVQTGGKNPVSEGLSKLEVLIVSKNAKKQLPEQNN
jgi:hypothetical protein